MAHVQLSLYPFYHIPSLSQCLASKTTEAVEEDQRTYRKYQDLISALPTDDGKVVFPLHNYHGFWFARDYLRGMLVARERFHARDTDVLLATSPKSGTTWLKAMLFCIANRGSGEALLLQSSLRTMSPHELFPFLEGQYMGVTMPDMDVLPSPRLFNTHAPCSLLPESLKESACKIVYICREPKDNFVSWWHYREKILAIARAEEALSFEDAFDLYCGGKFPWCPVWDHMLGYWEEHRRNPGKVLFLKYEEVKGDVIGTVKRMAEFMGCPLSDNEEMDAKGIVELCSFESLSNMEVNRSGKMGNGDNVYRNEVFFRRGKVGDWQSHLTPEMVQKINGITERKLSGTGLSFTGAGE